MAVSRAAGVATGVATEPSSRAANVCGEMTTTESPAFLSVAETARTLGLSEATVYRRVSDGSLPVLRLSEHGAIRIPASAITAEFAHRGESHASAPRTASEVAVEPPAHGGEAA